MNRVALALAIVLSLSATSGARAEVRIVVSVASSLRDAVDEIAGLYRSATGVLVDLNTGGSNTLARQIVAGARVDVFLSADDRQMDVVERAGLVAQGTRTALVTNELVLVAPVDAPAWLTAAGVLSGRISRLAMGEPSSVPAGVYGRQWLEHEGAWTTLSPKVVPFPTVRAVVAAVDAGRVDAGIVYATDVQGSTLRVLRRVTGLADLHIVYSAAVITSSSEAEGRRFVQFLLGESARAVFTRHGFGLP